MTKNKFTLAAVIAGIVAVLACLYRRPLPKVNGTINVRAKGRRYPKHGGGYHSPLGAPVEIIRDQWGVPHIYAQNLDDLFFAQGYAHAQDRLWQMELNRRIGHGRLSEIFGALTAEADHLLRIIGLSHAARSDLAAMDAETRGALESYARGVNTFIESNRSRMPLEFTLLGHKPEPWQPADSLVWGKMMAWGQGMNWDSELLRAALVDKLGAARAARLHGEYTADNPIIMHDHTLLEMFDHIGEHMREVEKWLPLAGMTGTSNNWVVDGNKSVTGKPLLANDPHLPLQIPSIWYENHLDSPQLQVTGVSLPGAPGVVLGHNGDIAWGATNAFADCQDLYVEKQNPDDPTLFEYNGVWEKADVRREEIRVKGEAEPRVVEITTTRHGPLMNPWTPSLAHLRTAGEVMQPDADDAPTMRVWLHQRVGVALRWVGHDTSRLFRAVLGVNRARNWNEFAAALADWTEPALSFVYADRAGNVGYYMAGNVPIRAQGMGITPAPGWTDEYEWRGYIPHDELPQALNPPQHYFATANNTVVGQEYPHFLTSETMNGFRARRIVELLTQKEKLSADDFARIHVDQYCAPAKTFCGLLLRLDLLNQPSLTCVRAQAERALDEIRRWDCNLTADSVAGAIYQVTQDFAMRRVFSPWLGELTDHFIGVGYHPLLAPLVGTYHDRAFLVLQRMLVNDEREWFKSEILPRSLKPLAGSRTHRDSDAGNAEGSPLTREEILAGALSDALEFLRQTLGDNIARWQWGALHKAHFNHPLGAKKPLDKIFNRGPFPYGGDTNTVWQAAFVPKFPISSEICGTASWRQIMDVSDWDASRAIHTTGQSGHPASKHYADMIPMWLNGEYHPLLWSREKVEANSEARLTLARLYPNVIHCAA